MNNAKHVNNSKRRISLYLFIVLLVCFMSSHYGFGQMKRVSTIEKKAYIEQAHILFEQGKLMDSIRQYARAVFMGSNDDNAQSGFIELFGPRVHQLRYSQFGPQSKEEVEFIAFYIRTVDRFNFLSHKEGLFHFFRICGLLMLIGVLGDTLVSGFFSKIYHKKTK